MSDMKNDNLERKRKNMKKFIINKKKNSTIIKIIKNF